MTREEFASLKEGDKVLIVSERTGGMNPDGLMDKYLDTVMTVRNIYDYDTVRMVEDLGEGYYGDGWYWFSEMIECVVFDDRLDDTSIEICIPDNAVDFWFS